MYSFGIFLYALIVRLLACFKHEKAQLMVRGHRDTWQKLRQGFAPSDRPVWFHAASLGEFEQGRPLMERLRREQPEVKILLTFFSPSGYEVRKDYDVADVVCYLPFDTPLNARRFLRLAHPSKAFFIKYEFWRNYLCALHKEGIPTYSVSAIFRPKQIFFRWYGLGYRRVLRFFTTLYLQNDHSAHLLERIGIMQVKVVGDTRFARVSDIKKAAKNLPLIEAFSQGAPTIVAGSTWQPDEVLLADYLRHNQEVKLVIAPHVISPSHLSELAQLWGDDTLRYSQANASNIEAARVLIIDSFGLLSSIYRYGTVAYVGGGFGVGIHNVPEAAVYGLPVLFGPNNEKFKEAQDLKACGACFEIQHSKEAQRLLDRLLTDTAFRENAGERAARYISENAQAATLIYNETLQ